MLMKIRVTISLPEETVEMARRHAFKNGATLSGIIRVMLQKELYGDKNEDRGFCEKNY
jgi:hypothetical protein